MYTKPLPESLGVDAKVVQELLRHASFKTTMDGYTQALEAPKRQAQAALADLIMRTGKVLILAEATCTKAATSADLSFKVCGSQFLFQKDPLRTSMRRW